MVESWEQTVISIADVAQEFVSSNEGRKRNFGTADNFKVAILGMFIQHIGYTGYYNTLRRLCYICWGCKQDDAQMLDCKQSLFFFRFRGGKGSARACERVSGVLLYGLREKRDCS